jgi:hypothetical protein
MLASSKSSLASNGSFCLDAAPYDPIWREWWEPKEPKSIRWQLVELSAGGARDVK